MAGAVCHKSSGSCTQYVGNGQTVWISASFNSKLKWSLQGNPCLDGTGSTTYKACLVQVKPGMATETLTCN